MFAGREAILRCETRLRCGIKAPDLAIWNQTRGTSHKLGEDSKLE